jgi:hypothetical protein
MNMKHFQLSGTIIRLPERLGAVILCVVIIPWLFSSFTAKATGSTVMPGVAGVTEIK